MKLPARRLADFSLSYCYDKVFNVGTASAVGNGGEVAGLGEPAASRGGRRRCVGSAAPPDLGEMPMENTLLIGLSRQIALHRELEVVANNIANLDTTGYKSDGSVFHEYLMPVARAGGFQG